MTPKEPTPEMRAAAAWIASSFAFTQPEDRELIITAIAGALAQAQAEERERCAVLRKGVEAGLVFVAYMASLCCPECGEQWGSPQDPDPDCCDKQRAAVRTACDALAAAGTQAAAIREGRPAPREDKAAEQTREAASAPARDREKSDPEVFARGEVAAVLLMDKPQAEALCVGLEAATGWRWDWSFMAGRVVLKYLRAAAPREAGREWISPECQHTIPRLLRLSAKHVHSTAVAFIRDLHAAADHLESAPREAGQREALPMVLHCPKCGLQHIDAPEPEIGWTNPPHKSHLCHGCHSVWRPADVPTTGVQAIQKCGERDTWPDADGIYRSPPPAEPSSAGAAGQEEGLREALRKAVGLMAHDVANFMTGEHEPDCRACALARLAGQPSAAAPVVLVTCRARLHPAWPHVQNASCGNSAAAPVGAGIGEPPRCSGSMKPVGLPAFTTATDALCPVCFQIVNLYGVGGEFVAVIHPAPAHPQEDAARIAEMDDDLSMTENPRAWRSKVLKRMDAAEQSASALRQERDALRERAKTAEARLSNSRESAETFAKDLRETRTALATAQRELAALRATSAPLSTEGAQQQMKGAK